MARVTGIHLATQTGDPWATPTSRWSGSRDLEGVCGGRWCVFGSTCPSASFPQVYPLSDPGKRLRAPRHLGCLLRHPDVSDLRGGSGLQESSSGWSAKEGRPDVTDFAPGGAAPVTQTTSPVFPGQSLGHLPSPKIL